MQFEIPSVSDTVSEQARTAIQLGAIAGKLALEERTIVWNMGGRPENVAEHSNMLSVVAVQLAEDYFPNLDTGLIAQLCPVHDIVEAYVGDTPTHEISDAGFSEKALLEARGFEQLKLEYAAYPAFIRLVDLYEAQKVPETRFIRMVDKLMPLLVHLNDNCDGLLSVSYKPEEIRRNSVARAQKFRTEYPDLEPIIRVREELAEIVATLLEQRQNSE